MERAIFFNSIDFAIFLPIVFVLYWGVTNRKIRRQNILVVLASYTFYGWWDWRFLSLIFFSTLVDFLIGIHLSKEEDVGRRKGLVSISILVNLGLLGFFKYFNFFIDGFEGAFSFLGFEINTSSLNIILPVGISFYTFQTLSYTIDVYRKRLEPTRDFVAFAAFVSFFPQLVAGPIERAANLLPQFYKKRVFNYTQAVDGMHQILWGLFKKVVVADNCALYVNEIFSRSSECRGSTLLLGAIFFGLQIYGDFSGYSDIAIGVSRLFGFRLMQNFAYPYFSRDIAEFWRRWHISLSTWFRDYLYIPLGGSRGSLGARIRNIFIIFIVSGFWHGANWTFIIWGALNAIYFLPILLTKRNRMHLDVVAQGKWLPSFKELLCMGATFFLTSVAWVFFRAESVGVALDYLSGIFSPTLFSMPEDIPLELCGVILMFMGVEWVGREEQYAIEKLAQKWGRPIRYMGYLFLLFLILYYSRNSQEFIYFQF